TAQEAALRIFEKRLLQEIGYGLVLDHEAISGRTVEADALYVYEVESGPVMQDHGNGGGKVLRGSSLLALARERLDDRAALKDAKHLMRTVLAHHLGGRPLHSRKLFASTGGGAGEGFKR
ncbi:MAG: hypothetical protein GWN84_22775, partial [Gammaproteobacteria bacterium]|nr:hypothetical protein [Gammaproteobacteria bacterium]NIR85433.1 hypothetical protein [Gammaproteobacteria bacterium]NIU06569.1 hypothetical protein [Gammaproteobacteria bacterium]NIV74652.1 hypothetical protein [Gammaproteobacteria bacterium]NIX87842.1 hypothetical protein [Gammaproteobacteria bacterium]